MKNGMQRLHSPNLNENYPKALKHPVPNDMFNVFSMDQDININEISHCH